MTTVYRTLAEARSAPAERLAIGFFDGLHRGHREVILGDAEAAAERAVVFTFEPHPARVLRPAQAPPLLTGLPHKIRLLQDWGVGGILAFPFDLERSRQEARAFLEEIFDALPWIRQVRVGVRWRFGHGRQGEVGLLATVCRARGLACQISPDVMMGEEPISSSRIRAAVQAGDLTGAASMLGRAFQIYGKVGEGRKLGRRLGFPTANLQTADECFPPPGVYAGWVKTEDGTRHPAVMNLGSRPTVGDRAGTYLEAHLLDGEHDLYGTEIFLEPLHFLRPVAGFTHLEELGAVIGRDAAEAARRLGIAYSG